MKINDDHSRTSSLKNFNDELIEIKKILEIIVSQEEEFLFFVHLAASKIPDDNQKAEHYYSLVFLNELLNENTSEKEFTTNWQNLFNIFYNKMDFKHLFDKEENLFDIMYINYFMYEIIIRFYKFIESRDYFQILENYLEIDNAEVLYLIMENNNKLVITATNSNLLNKEGVIEVNLNLMMKLVDYFSSQMTNTRNIYFAQRLSNCLAFLGYLFECFDDFNILSSDSLSVLNKIVNIFYEHSVISQFSYLFGYSSENVNLVYELINAIVSKMIPNLPKVDDEKWSLYITILQFCLNSLKTQNIDNEDIRRKLFHIVITMYQKPLIPLVKFAKITGLMDGFFNGFSLLKNKSEESWSDVFNAFYFLFINNEELLNSSIDMDSLWSIFVKKYLTAYVDTSSKAKIRESETMNILNNIFPYIMKKGKFKYY